MDIAFHDAETEAAASPQAIAQLGRDEADDLSVILTVLGHAASLADVLTLRSMSLTRLSTDEGSDYDIGTAATGVVLRPVNPRGQLLLTSHTKESLMAVHAITIQSVGHSRQKEATA